MVSAKCLVDGQKSSSFTEPNLFFIHWLTCGKWIVIASTLAIQGKHFVDGIFNFAVMAQHEWWGAGLLVSLERGADLHMARLMPLPLSLLFQ